jgi:galactose mutarotase-like enzyme
MRAPRRYELDSSISKTLRSCEAPNVSDDKNPWLSLNSGDLSVEIDPLGAQLSTLRDHAGRDLLWGGDPSVWAGRAPLLFPIVGALAGGHYRLAGTTYPLPRHGFARVKRFAVGTMSSSAATLRLNADAATLQVYPFEFELDVRFALDGATLSITTTVRNLGDEDMPASIGYHPGFRWPLPFGRPRSSHFIEFAMEEPDPVRRLNTAGLLTPERHPTPIAHRRLMLGDALFQDDVIIFDRIRSRHVTYGADEGPRIRVSYPDAPYLGIWSKPQAPFICIEPWHGVADPEGFTGDFKTKPGVVTVAADAVLSAQLTVTLLGS